MSDVDADLDYERLSKALDKHLSSVEHLRIPKDQLKLDYNDRLGAGGYGQVYAGTRTIPDLTDPPIKVAIKVLRSTEATIQIRLGSALARELTCWARVNHTNILPLLGFYLDMESGVAWLVSPRMLNGNVRQYFANTNPDLKQKRKTVIEFSEALAYLHGRDTPICHGDLKPDNILVKDDGSTMLCDFGLAVAIEEDSQHTGLTTSVVLKGTVRYMSPELVAPDDEEDPKRTLKSDIWAWGCVVAELMTGVPPYMEFSNTVSIIEAIKDGPPSSALEIPGLPYPLIEAVFDEFPHSRPKAEKCLGIVQNKMTIEQTHVQPPIPPQTPPLPLSPTEAEEEVEPKTARLHLPLSWRATISQHILEGEVRKAVELLEHARAVIYTPYQANWRSIQQAFPILAEQYLKLTMKLDDLPPSWPVYGPVPKADEVPTPGAKRSHLEEWVTTVESIRRIPHWDNFLNHPSFDYLQHAADHGPVVVFNSSDIRSDAIIIRGDRDPSVVPLVAHTQVADTLPDSGAASSSTATVHAEGNNSNDSPTKDEAISVEGLCQNYRELITAYSWSFNLESRAAGLLRKIWNLVVGPVLDVLAQQGSPSTSGANSKKRIWWSPDSQLWILPMHAAGHYHDFTGPRLRDSWISSYTVSLDALMRANAGRSRKLARSAILFVGEAGSSGISAVEESLRRVQNVASCIRLEDARADLPTLRKQISRHPMLHASWCINQDTKVPLNSTFNANGGISSNAIFEDNAQNTRLAFFACCHRHPDSSYFPFPFPAAMQLAGLDNIVTTVSATDLGVMAEVADSFWSHLFKPPNKQLVYSNTAQALDAAVQSLQTRGISLDKWMIYVHFGL